MSSQTQSQNQEQMQSQNAFGEIEIGMDMDMGMPPWMSFGTGLMGNDVDWLGMDGRANGSLCDKLPVQRLARPVAIITTHLANIGLGFPFLPFSFLYL